jgi:DNA primase
MPEGKDPDDLLRAEGAGAFQALIDRALPMVRLLWQRETEGRDFDSPERKAALERACQDKTALIRDPALRRHYEQALKDLRWELFSPRRPDAPGRWRPRGAAPAATPRTSTKASALAAAGDAAQTTMREAVILAALLQCPALVEEFEPALENLVRRDRARNP